jgi:hypothetical protein
MFTGLTNRSGQGTQLIVPGIRLIKRREGGTHRVRSRTGWDENEDCAASPGAGGSRCHAIEHVTEKGICGCSECQRFSVSDRPCSKSSRAGQCRSKSCRSHKFYRWPLKHAPGATAMRRAVIAASSVSEILHEKWVTARSADWQLIVPLTPSASARPEEARPNWRQPILGRPHRVPELA